MKNMKKIILSTILITLLFICSLSTISAANQTINDTSTGGIAKGITDTDPNDTLFLEEGTYNKSSDRGITISKNITIQGKGPVNKVIIDAQGLNRIFIINNNLNVTFINITFINAYSTANGGAIYENNLNTTITVINCAFTNNTANNGGAIYNNGNSINVVNSTFTNNTAVTTSGGAINLMSGSTNFIISNNTFNNNAATSGTAGAISINGVINGTISNNNFSNNFAFLYGGAVFNNNNNLNIIIVNNNFSNNVANTYAGAIYNTGSSNLTISNNNLINNTASAGGSIFLNGGENITISNNDFSSNVANNPPDNFRGGGAILLNGVRDTLISNNNFTNNTSSDLGGAIYNRRGVDINITNNIFVNNNASVEGGGIYNNGTMTLFKNTMAGNSAGLGQMIYNNGTMGVLTLIYLSNSTVKTSKGSNVTVYATLTDDMGNTVTGQDISFYVDGVFVANVTSVEGKANTAYLVTKGPVSVLPVTGDYAGHDGYSIVLKNGELLVPKIPTNITVSVPEEVKVGETATIESKLTDKDGNPIANATVDFYVDGKKIGSAVTDENGIAKIEYTFTKAGKPNIVAKYAGNDTYLASNASAKTTVSKIKTKITIKVKGDKVTATLTDENGNPIAGKKITFRIKGVVIGVGITDANGQVTIYYKNAEQNTITATFAGDNRYEPASAASTPISENAQASGKVAMKETGLPIIPTILALIASISIIGYRKKEE